MSIKPKDAIVHPSESVIKMAFSTYTTGGGLGRNAYLFMNRNGLQATLDEYKCEIVGSLKSLPMEMIEAMIEDLVSNAQALSVQNRKSTLQEVHHAVKELNSIEEVLDYLTLELESHRESPDIDDAKLLAIYQQQAIEIFDEKIQNKEIELKDVPKLLARYGLMQTYEFTRHIDEMMQLKDPERKRDSRMERFYGMAFQVLNHMGYKFIPVAEGSMWRYENFEDLENIKSGASHSLDEALDDILGIHFREQDWEFELEKGGFEGSWMDFQESKLSEYLSENNVGAKGLFVGKVVKIDKGLVHQKTGPNPKDITVHALYRFKERPEKGQILEINYKNGQLNSFNVDLGKGKSKER